MYYALKRWPGNQQFCITIAEVNVAQIVIKVLLLHEPFPELGPFVKILDFSNLTPVLTFD